MRNLTFTMLCILPQFLLAQQGFNSAQTQMANLATLPPPIFPKNGKVHGVVSAQKLIDYLDYSFLVKNLLILN